MKKVILFAFLIIGMMVNTQIKFVDREFLKGQGFLK
jgi:hypothetical protein